MNQPTSAIKKRVTAIIQFQSMGFERHPALFSSMEMLQVFEPFSVEMCGEVVDHLIEVAFENLFELMQRQACPVISNAVLRVVIGPDPLRPVA